MIGQNRDGQRAAPELLPPPPTLALGRTALFADLDGTLAKMEETPDLVGPDAARRRLLAQLEEALGGRLAVVSGRGLADLDRVLERRIPAVAAVHGLVRRASDGRVIEGEHPRQMGEAVEALSCFAAADRRLLVENKGAAAALHFRRSPEAAEASREVARRLAARYGLTVQEGDMVVELRAPGADKGGAVRAFMAEPPFAGFEPVFLGDDLTDENGFEAAEALGGFGIVVGPRRPTAARYALQDVEATRRWLRRSLDAGR